MRAITITTIVTEMRVVSITFTIVIMIHAGGVVVIDSTVDMIIVEGMVSRVIEVVDNVVIIIEGNMITNRKVTEVWHWHFVFIPILTTFHLNMY